MTITKDGQFTAMLIHTHEHAPGEWKSQTRTGKLDPDGKTIRGHASWDDGGHNFTWTLREPWKAAEK